MHAQRNMASDHIKKCRQCACAYYGKHYITKERSKSVTDPLIIPHPSRLSSAELPVLGGPKKSMLIDGANPYHFRSIQCFAILNPKNLYDTIIIIPSHTKAISK
jgi:hypothetical protein